MLFGKVYDDTLWLMLKADNKNREKIIEFIKELPEEVILKIRQDITRVMTKPGKSVVQNLYDANTRYQIHLDEEWLDIAKSLKANDDYSEVFILTLCNYKLLASKKGNAKKAFAKEWLGDVSYQETDLKVAPEAKDEFEYEIVDSPLGILVTYKDKKLRKHHKYLWPTRDQIDFQKENLGGLSRKKVKSKRA